MGRRPIIWLSGEVKSPPFSAAGRREAGFLLGLIQAGVHLAMPHSRPMPSIGPRCHELRVRDERHNWRIVYRADEEEVLVVAVFAKTTQQTPAKVIADCKRRLSLYSEAPRREGGDGTSEA